MTLSSFKARDILPRVRSSRNGFRYEKQPTLLIINPSTQKGIKVITLRLIIFQYRTLLPYSHFTSAKILCPFWIISIHKISSCRLLPLHYHRTQRWNPINKIVNFIASKTSASNGNNDTHRLCFWAFNPRLRHRIKNGVRRVADEGGNMI